jgi:hypothetical protein
LAAVLGDNVGYVIGRFGGRLLVLRVGRYIFLTTERIDPIIILMLFSCLRPSLKTRKGSGLGLPESAGSASGIEGITFKESRRRE